MDASKPILMFKNRSGYSRFIFEKISEEYEFDDYCNMVAAWMFDNIDRNYYRIKHNRFSIYIYGDINRKIELPILALIRVFHQYRVRFTLYYFDEKNKKYIKI